MKIRCLILVLILCLLPVTVLAAIEPSSGVDRVGQTITLSGNYEEYTISGIEENDSIIVESGVKRLILNGASIIAPGGQTALRANGSLELRLTGASTIAGGSSNANGGHGIVLPEDGRLTINGEGNLKISGGNSLYERDENVHSGTGGTAIVGSVVIEDRSCVTAKGGRSEGGYWTKSKEVQGGNGIDGSVEINGGQLKATGGSAANADHSNKGGHGITGNAIVHSGLLTATGGSANRGQYNDGGHGIAGDAIVNSGQAIASGGAVSGGSPTALIINSGGHGVHGNAVVNAGSLPATGGQASEGKFTTRNESYNQAGHGVNKNAVVNGGQLIATGNSASSPLPPTGPDYKPIKNFGGNGVNGAFTATGGYVLARGGDGDEDRKGKAAATEGFLVTIGSSETFLTASVGEGTTPNTPLNNGEIYTAAKDETPSVSGKRSLETKEHFAVTYSCAYDGCENTYTDYADGSKAYTVKTPASLGFQDHGLAFAGFVDINGIAVDSLTVSGPTALKATWKVVFTFDAGEEGVGSVPPIDVITSSSTVRLPACSMTAPAGYQFAGWMIDGEDTIYAAQDEVPAAREIRLRAVWKLIPALPDTGDSGMPVLWALLCLGSCIMLLQLRARAKN